MSHRIFVNTQNQTYKQVTQNGKGTLFGLGTSTELSDEERIALGQTGSEIYFSADDLREKQRKIKILFDSFTDPKFFGDGAVKIDKVQKYITDLQLEVERARANPNLTTAAQLAASGYGAVTGVAAAQAATTLVLSGAPALGIPATVITTGGFGAAAAAFLPAAGIIAAANIIGSIIKSNAQANREDNAAPWKMTTRDFPNITSQAIAGNSNRRSIERLYDSRTASDVARNRNQVSTEEAIARLIREALADALFCTSNSPNGITSPEHPGPQSVNELKKHFPFTVAPAGADRLERTYVNGIIYLQNYIELIDNILNLQNQSLSRSPDEEQALINIPIRISLSTANVQLFSALSATARQVVREKVLTFFDENREYKTLLNFGDDRQYVAEAWRIAPKDTGSIQLKLITPLDTDITTEAPAFISREIAESVVDIINFELGPLADSTPYLRPFNMDSRNYVESKMFSSNTTLTSLGLSTGSSGAIISGSTVSYEDTVFRRWFTGDFKSSELNVDFTDYNNFVHFGSAYKRLQAFTEKLEKIEQLTSASISSSVSSSTVSLMLKAREKENIIRNFDPYEQFLYYAPMSTAYSASAFYTNSEIEYNATASWPKQADGTVHSPYSTTAINWLNTQLGIASRYDDNNPNYLILNLPKYIQEDVDSTDFLTLFNMVGHLIDNIKVYIDQFPNIYSTNPNPFEELSMDQVYEIAQSFGLKLPNVYALENLQTFNAQFAGESGSRSYVAETWKRFLHNMVYFNKTKGSRTSFDALLNTYGINSPVLQIKETTSPTAGNYIRSDELTYGLRFTGSVVNNITVPFVSSSITASTLQLSFNPIKVQSSSLLTGGTWAIDLVPHPSSSKIEYGRIQIVSGSGRTVIASSSYFPLFSDDYTNIMLRSQSGDISIIQTDGDQILFQESASVNLSSLWNTTTRIYLGGTGSIKLGTNFDGIIDEIRVWGENISNDDFVAQAYDPGSYYGSNYTSSYSKLYVHVPFSQPLTSITSSVRNESPYQNVSIVQTLPALGFTTASFIKVLRSIKQFTPIVGSTIFTNKKVVVADAPIFNKQFVDDNGTRILSRLTSIKQVEEKVDNSGKNVVSFNISPTDFVNQDIIRSMGVVDVNNLIGSPRYITGSSYSTLQSIQKDYVTYFNKTISPNDYIRFFKDLTQGPSEMADEMVPARAKLIDGIVIESSVLSRNKDTIIRKFAVDGSATKKFVSYISGSGSIGVGAYDFDTLTEPVSLVPDTLGYTLPLDAAIEISSSVSIKSSTRPNKLATSRKVVQQINSSYVSGRYATSSFLDDNSSYATLETTITSFVSASTTGSGYPRTPYIGTALIPSESNTLIPFYNIQPRSDFEDVGTITYFHKSNGIYSYDIYTKYKVEYLTKLDTTTEDAFDRLYAPITLLPSNTQLNPPGRYTTTISSASYGNTNRTGVIKIANIFSLYALSAPSGLRIRLYRNAGDLASDSNRSFNTVPSQTAGVLLDIITNGTQDVFPYTLIQTENSNIYYNIENTTITPIDASIGLTYFAYEPANLLPSGYLPRHYKFNRDNTTALKRRNYIGCRNISTIFDSTSPIVVTLSSANTVVVNSRTTETSTGTGTINVPEQIDTIKFGGGGRLNVE